MSVASEGASVYNEIMASEENAGQRVVRHADPAPNPQQCWSVES